MFNFDGLSCRECGGPQKQEYGEDFAIIVMEFGMFQGANFYCSYDCFTKFCARNAAPAKEKREAK